MRPSAWPRIALGQASGSASGSSQAQEYPRHFLGMFSANTAKQKLQKHLKSPTWEFSSSDIMEYVPLAAVGRLYFGGFDCSHCAHCALCKSTTIGADHNKHTRPLTETAEWLRELISGASLPSKTFHFPSIFLFLL